MINKILLQSLIKKYHLGEIDQVKWVVKNKQLSIDFQSINRETLGNITCTDIDLPDSELAIFDTKKLLNLLSITQGDLLLELEKTKDIFTKLVISDSDFNVTYALADLLLIPKVGKVNEPEWDCSFELEAENINNLVKAKNALNEVDNMVLTTEKDLNDDLMLKFTFGDEQGHNNKITYQLYGEIHTDNIKLPFNSNMFRTILKENSDMEVGSLKLNSQGLMKLEFQKETVKSTYFIVRKEQTNF